MGQVEVANLHFTVHLGLIKFYGSGITFLSAGKGMFLDAALAVVSVELCHTEQRGHPH